MTPRKDIPATNKNKEGKGTGNIKSQHTRRMLGEASRGHDSSTGRSASLRKGHGTERRWLRRGFSLGEGRDHGGSEMKLLTVRRRLLVLVLLLLLLLLLLLVVVLEKVHGIASGGGGRRDSAGIHYIID